MTYLPKIILFIGCTIFSSTSSMENNQLCPIDSLPDELLTKTMNHLSPYTIVKLEEKEYLPKYLPTLTIDQEIGYRYLWIIPFYITCTKYNTTLKKEKDLIEMNLHSLNQYYWTGGCFKNEFNSYKPFIKGNAPDQVTIGLVRLQLYFTHGFMEETIDKTSQKNKQEINRLFKRLSTNKQVTDILCKDSNIFKIFVKYGYDIRAIHGDNTACTII